MTAATALRSFDDYLKSVDFLVLIDAPEPERIEAAWIAGRQRGNRHPGQTYLFDRLRAAFGD